MRSGWGIWLCSGPGVSPSFLDPCVPNSDSTVQILSVPVLVSSTNSPGATSTTWVPSGAVRSLAEPFSTMARAFAWRRACLRIWGEVRLSGFDRTESDDDGASLDGTATAGDRAVRPSASVAVPARMPGASFFTGEFSMCERRCFREWFSVVRSAARWAARTTNGLLHPSRPRDGKDLRRIFLLAAGRTAPTGEVRRVRIPGRRTTSVPLRRTMGTRRVHRVFHPESRPR